MKRSHYQVRVKGRPEGDWAAWFDGFTLTSVGEDETLLSGELPDQSALHGLLAQVRDLNLVLISVQLCEQGDDEP